MYKNLAGFTGSHHTYLLMLYYMSGTDIRFLFLSYSSAFNPDGGRQLLRGRQFWTG